MRIILFIMVVVFAGAFALAEDLPSEVYRRVSEVYGSSLYFDAETLFDGVRGSSVLVRVARDSSFVSGRATLTFCPSLQQAVCGIISRHEEVD